MSTVFFAKETLPRMQKNKWGRLITITSSAVKQPVDGLLLSNSIRAAVTGLARTLANEYAADGITVNNVCPGYTRTARTDDLASTISARTGSKPEDVIAAWEREVPAGRLGTPYFHLTVPFVVFGLFRYLYLVHQHGAGEDPSRLLVSDAPLLASVMAWGIVVLLLLYGPGLALPLRL